MTDTSGYSETRFFCPLCGTEGLLKTKRQDLTIAYCSVCKQEMLIVLDPVVQPIETEAEHQTTH